MVLSGLLLIVLTLFSWPHLASARLCKSVNVRNSVSSLHQLRGCTVVEGYVQIVLIEKANETDFDHWSFPELREVTQYLLFYRVQGLRRLGQLFPSLVRIGGVKLFIDYGLVVHEMFSLQELGLSSLREISRGSVILTKNPSLCYVNTIDWDVIAPWDPVKNYVANNKSPKDCPSCPHNCTQALCWNRFECQVLEDKSGCDPLCVGGCSGPGPQHCHSCRRVLGPDGECLESCPPGTYKYLNRRCISEEECTSIDLPQDSRSVQQFVSKYVTHNGTCTDSCPPGFELSSGKGCVPCAGGKCHKWCLGMNIENIGDAQALRGCTHIQGSLEISIKSGKPNIVSQELEQNLGAIQEIESYLKIVRSFPIVNLKFLNSLSVIHGKENAYSDAGFRDNYSFLVLENPNIQELWDNSKPNFKINNGKVFFHYNPKLCLQHIYEFLSIVNHQNVSDLEVGKDSNGDKFPCNATEIEIYVTNKSSNAIEISVPYLKVDYNLDILRYVVYFTKDPYKNITMFEDLDQCSDYGWKTKDISVDPKRKIISNNTFRVNLTDLEPYTEYAFYVTTYTINRIGAKSSLHYAKTLPSKPSEISRLEAFSNTSFEINVEWTPPEHVNGRLQEYVVTWTLLDQLETLVDLRNYCEYPAVQEEAVDAIKLSPTIQKNQDCCDKKPYSPKNGFEKLCLNYNRCPFEKDKIESDYDTSCESCFYSYVYKSPFHKGIESSISRLRKSTAFNHVEGSHTFGAKRAKLGKAHVSGNTTKFKITNLLNFRDYVVSVQVCREEDSQEFDKTDANRCSRADIVTVRTTKNNMADKVNSPVVYKILNNTAILSWDPPLHSNGIIVAYEIDYRHTNIENTNPITECITTREYESNRGTFHISSLTEGRFEVRVRAITLAGKGPFSEYVHFTISNATLSMSDILSFVLFTCLAIICFIIMSIITLYKKKKHPLDGILIASVNPEYQYVQDEWEIGKENVELVKEIGTGSFGKVYEGLLKTNNTPCAVKTVHEDLSEHAANVFLSEASVMKSVTEAYHIVRLLGVVSTTRPPLMVMELMSQGDLKSFLRSSRETEPPTKSAMIKIAYQIGDGMAFMESKKFVHRDLAARNCLVSSDCVVKIGDFGMTRDIYETDYYRKTTAGLLPIRWMAPESLKDGVFTSQSDVWSYGVVLWEIVTLAEQPYQGSSNDQVLQEVIEGRRLDVPPQTPTPLRYIMESCWRKKPSHRRSFMQIVRCMEHHHDEEFKKVSYFYSTEGLKARKGVTEYVEMKSVEDPLLGTSTQTPRLANVSTLLSRPKFFARFQQLSSIAEASSYE